MATVTQSFFMKRLVTNEGEIGLKDCVIRRVFGEKTKKRQMV